MDVRRLRWRKLALLRTHTPRCKTTRRAPVVALRRLRGPGEVQAHPRPPSVGPIPPVAGLMEMAWRSGEAVGGPIDIARIRCAGRPKGFVPYQPRDTRAATAVRIEDLFAEMRDADALPLG